MHAEQEIELLEDISQQLKSILAKFHKIHKNRKKSSQSDSKSKITKTSPGADLSDQSLSKIRFEMVLVSNKLSSSHWKLSTLQFQTPTKNSLETKTVIDFTKSENNELKDRLRMKELEVSKLNTIVEVLEKEIRNQKFLKLQSKKQEERINRLQADVNKYKSESNTLRKQMKENTKEYEMQLKDKDSTINEYLKVNRYEITKNILYVIYNLYNQTIP